MAGSTGAPVGPFPTGVEGADAEAEYDKLRRRVLWAMPSGLYLVGSRLGPERNFMTANWATQLSFEPKLLGVSVEDSAVTHGLIAGGGAFSLCLIDREDRAIVRRFVKPATLDEAASTLNGFAFRDGAETGVPILAQAAAWMECVVRDRVACGHHTLFIGEIVAAGFNVADERPVLRMEDTRMNYGG
jgi:flavin reductase (DIM6/NTAB) family NADH-FMN oxidoreductase RutF